MVGQGSPDCARQRPLRDGRFVLRRWAGSIVWAGFLVWTVGVAGDDLDLRVRISWGGGARRLWRGVVSLSAGQLSEPRCLGVEADAPPELELNDRQLSFRQRVPVSLDGLDLRVRAPGDTTLRIDFFSGETAEAEKTVELKLDELLPAIQFAHDSPLDHHQNRLQIGRAPGDRLRVRIDRDSLVFAPGDEFAFEVQPYGVGLPEGTAMRCVVGIEVGGEVASRSRQQFDLRLDAEGSSTPIGPVKILLPEHEEGSYDVVISLYQRRLTDAIGRIGDVLPPGKPWLERRVQLVVLDAQPFQAAPADWRLVDELDSANPKWWEKWVPLRPLKRLPGIASGITTSGPLGDQPLRAREYRGLQLKELGPSGWHAAPIPVSRIGEPHVLEVEYPRGYRQTLGISVLEEDAVGQIGSQGIDAGFDAAREAGTEAELERYRLVFWPRTKTPWLLLTNRRDDAVALLGAMRVLAGPEMLPVAANARDAGNGTRRMAVLLDKPWFPRTFGAPEIADAGSQRSITDWSTFYFGAVRLAEYLKYAGYHAAFVPAVAEGTSLYPTRLLDTLPKYDSGQLAWTGQDPVAKDVLELLLRVFDREGLSLIPCVQFGMPLPEVEAQLRRAGASGGGAKESSGLLLVGGMANDPRLLAGSRVDARQGLAPYYNPLDPRVQLAMRRVVGELLMRCAAHPSFDGISLQMVPYGYGQLPDDTWALDDVTFARFLRETGASAPPSEGSGIAARAGLIQGKLRDQWLSWRAAKLTQFYQTLQQDVARLRPSAQLYLDLHELVAGRVAQTSLRPQLPERDEFQDRLLRHGLDGNLLGQLPGVVLLRPHRVAPLLSLPAQGANLELEHSHGVDRFFRRSGSAAGMVAFHEVLPLRVPGFDQVSPLGLEKTRTNLLTQVRAAGPMARAPLVRSLVALDPSLFVTGGLMVPLGHEDSLRRTLEVLGALPDVPFVDVPTREAVPGVAVRSLTQGQETYVYAANATSIRAKVTVELPRLPAETAVRELPGGKPSAFGAAEGTWTADLAPYDVAALVISRPNVSPANWGVDVNADDVAEMLRQVQDLRSRVDDLRRPRPLAVLENPGFENAPSDGQLPGWTATPGVAVKLDHETARSGRASLHLHLDGTQPFGRVRSNLFSLPRTGRLSFLARLRTNDASRQPAVRLAIEGRLADGSPFYRFSESLGVTVDGRTLRPQAGTARPLPVQWTQGSEGEFLFHFSQLPAGVGGQISIGLDLLGPGDVWVDDVEVFDLYFQDEERLELAKKVQTAALQLRTKNFTACQNILDGYWPRFVLEFGETPRISQVPTTPADAAPPAEKPAAAAPPEKRSWWNRLSPRGLFSR